MNYQDHPQGVYSAPVEMRLSPEAYPAYGRHSTESYASVLPYDGDNLYPEAHYMYNSRSSPAVYPDDGEMRVPSSNLSTTSATSSNMGSPLSHHDQLSIVPDWAAQPGLNSLSPGIVEHHGDYFTGTEYSFAPPMDSYNPQFEFSQPKGPGYLDPNLIHPDMQHPMAIATYDNTFPHHNQPYPTSPALSPLPQVRNGSTSPFLHANNYQQYSPYPTPVDQQARRVSFHSAHSGEPLYSGDESKEKQRCLDCQKTFKDLKAHMLTHQLERPEKCPIQTCEYHIKGFARKYDKNRHTLTHYKGTMVCGFCPGPGSAAEKSFNRADVFKRHLTAVHGVEQTPPNSRKKTAGVSSGKKLTGYPPDATGKCSTCSATFSNAQEFYEHLDDCVLRIVQQEDPAEAINAKHMAEVENDREVHNTLEKNQLPTTTMTSNTEEEDEEAADESDEETRSGKLLSPTKKSKENPVNGVQKSRGLTRSRGGVPLPTRSRGRKSRRDFPTSWGFDKGQMTMRKRVMAVFDGQHRLAKDDMMLMTNHEVRLPLSDGRSYITDLDFQTLRRADGYLQPADDESSQWVSDDLAGGELQQMLDGQH